MLSSAADALCTTIQANLCCVPVQREGTSLNGERLAANRPVRLRHGAKLSFAAHPTTLTFQCDESSEYKPTACRHPSSFETLPFSLPCFLSSYFLSSPTCPPLLASRQTAHCASRCQRGRAGAGPRPGEGLPPSREAQGLPAPLILERTHGHPLTGTLPASTATGPFCCSAQRRAAVDRATPWDHLRVRGWASEYGR